MEMYTDRGLHEEIRKTLNKSKLSPKGTHKRKNKTQCQWKEVVKIRVEINKIWF